MSYATYTLRDNRMVLVEERNLSAVRDPETGDPLFNDEGYLIFEETDGDSPYYIDVQLQCGGSEGECQLRMVVYDDDMAGGFVHYAGEKERVPIHFARSEKAGDADVLYFNEIRKGKTGGTYLFTLRGASVDDVCYIREEERKVFRLK